MKQGLFTLGLSVALSIMAGCRSQQEGWKLVWEENFVQEDHFDEASWSKIPRGKSDWNNYMWTSIPAILCAMAIWFCVD